MRKLLAAIAALIFAPTLAFAQSGSTPSNAVGNWGLTAAGAPCLVAPVGAAGKPTCFADPANLFYGGTAVTPMTVGTVYPAGRAIMTACSGAGNIIMTDAAGDTITWIAAVGSSILPFTITQIQTSGTTATCTYTNLP